MIFLKEALLLLLHPLIWTGLVRGFWVVQMPVLHCIKKKMHYFGRLYQLRSILLISFDTLRKMIHLMSLWIISPLKPFLSCKSFCELVFRWWFSFFLFVARVREEEVATSRFWWSVKLDICILLLSGKGWNMMDMLLLRKPYTRGFFQDILSDIFWLSAVLSCQVLSWFWSSFEVVPPDSFQEWMNLKHINLCCCVRLGTQIGVWFYIIYGFAFDKINQLQWANMTPIEFNSFLILKIKCFGLIKLIFLPQISNFVCSLFLEQICGMIYLFHEKCSNSLYYFVFRRDLLNHMRLFSYLVGLTWILSIKHCVGKRVLEMMLIVLVLILLGLDLR